MQLQAVLGVVFLVWVFCEALDFHKVHGYWPWRFARNSATFMLLVLITGILLLGGAVWRG